MPDLFIFAEKKHPTVDRVELSFNSVLVNEGLTETP